ncbi:carboxymuconolactone decarboxylase family protein [Planotetraspora sp. A-T 1434]|uniref:carboxymuconolactone decarboxylase family protein n=1 Tax=Planotetraspora sp. A-T 1434 TaxID=2979219 RepID=UPI0021BE1AD1|nr:carboxymuconolactone decarboxylase family protein [Planotetraspora sp. A-T 1434]MCT9930374.1 carboxymuconolactone decarboxylase family protein [Planotetraspora sp. A-T 1434]
MKSMANPDVITAIQHLHKAIHAGGVDPLVLELVHLRASQINGCSPCVFAGVQSAKKHGDRGAAAQRGHLARDAFFTEEERAALALTDPAPLPAGPRPGLPPSGDRRQPSL